MNDNLFELIVERSLLASVVALLPLPFVDDYLLKRARIALLWKIAADAKINLSRKVLEVLAADPPRSLMHRAGESVLIRTLQKGALPLRLVSRARTALETFELAILFAHCAHRVPSVGVIDEKQARLLRKSIDEVLREVHFGWTQLRDVRAHADVLRTQFDAHAKRIT